MKVVRTTQPHAGIGPSLDFPFPAYLWNFGEGMQPVNRGRRYRHATWFTTSTTVYQDGVKGGLRGLRNTPVFPADGIYCEPEWRSFDSWCPANTAAWFVASFVHRPYVSNGSSANAVFSLGGMDAGTGFNLYAHSSGAIYCQVCGGVGMTVAAVAQVGKLYNVVAGRDDAGNCWTWCNGVLVDTNTGATGALSVTSGVKLEVLGDANWSRGYDGTLFMLGFYSGNPVAYGRELSRNPWQLFGNERDDRTVFLPPAVTSTTKRWHRIGSVQPVRTTQPQGQAEIDWSNPITKDLALVFDGTKQCFPNQRDIKTGTKPNVAVIPQLGPFRSTSVGTIAGVGTTDRIETTVTHHADKRTLVFWIQRNPITPIVRRIIDKTGVGSSTGDAVAWYNDASVSYYVYHDAGYTLWTASSSTGWDGQWACGAFSHDRTAMNQPLGYWNGRQSAMSDITPTGTAWLTNNAPIYLGNRDGFDRNYEGDIGPVLVFDRILSPDEIKSLYENPWQIFKSDSRLAWTEQGMAEAFISFVTRAYGPDGQRMNTGLRR